MMFRKLYWVTELVDPIGNSRVSGVYTSIPELIRHGLSSKNGDCRVRLTLAKLDSEKEPFGVWCEPDFSGLADRLTEFIETDEFSSEHCHMLVDHLGHMPSMAA
jgi:hypothetical protein